MGEIWAKSISSNIFHLMLVRQWWHGTGRIFPIEGIVEKEEVREPSANRDIGFLEGLEIRLDHDLTLIDTDHTSIQRRYNCIG